MRGWGRANSASVAVIAGGAAMATIIARGLTRPMDDSSEYRAAARNLAHGWTQLTYRTPGYPLLLWLTGSSTQETHLLFAVQLVMHGLAVALAVDVARRLGLSTRGGAAVALLLMVPPVAMQTWLSGSEVPAELLVTLSFWGCARWVGTHRCRDLLVAGTAAGTAVVVRPALVLLWIPCLVMVVLERRASVDAEPRPGRARTLACLLVPVVMLVGGLSVLNWVRFDSPGLTPLLPWHLSTRTSEYVELLPASDEPARSYLIGLRDRAYTGSVDHATAEYLNQSDPAAFSKVTGLGRRQLDRYLLHLDLVLIVHHPFRYGQAVVASVGHIWEYNSQPGGFGTSGAVGWVANLAHDLLALLTAFVLVIVVGARYRRSLDPRFARIWFVGLGIVVSDVVVSVAVESGSPRLLFPTYPVLAVLLVAGWSVARSERRAAVA